MERRGDWGRGMRLALVAVVAITSCVAPDEASIPPDVPSDVAREETPPTETTGPPPARHRIAADGRLSFEASALPSDGPVTVALELSDESRGGGPLAVRIAAEDGRQIETTAVPDSGGGVQVEIDPSWLTPGRYLIEVKTPERTHFPLRRYVLEVQ